MRKFVLVGAALIPTYAFSAEAPKAPSLDQQVEQAQTRLYAAQSDFYSAVARKFQADLAKANKDAVDTHAWWDAWWKGMFPDKPATE